MANMSPVIKKGAVLFPMLVIAGSLALTFVSLRLSLTSTEDVLWLPAWGKVSKAIRSETSVNYRMINGDEGTREQTNASAYCGYPFGWYTSSEKTRSEPPLASEQNGVVEISLLKHLCGALIDGTVNQYKKIKIKNCPFWLHERGDETRQIAPKIKGPMVILPGTSTKTSKYNQIEGRWRKKSTKFIQQFAQSIMKGVGNQLSEVYMLKYAAAAVGVPVINGCADMDGPRDSRNGTVQSLMPVCDNVNVSKDDRYPSWQEICNLDENDRKFPHTLSCPNCLAKVSASIRRDLRAVAHKWACENKHIDLDEATIHVRCGDIIQSRGWTEYGFIPYRAYSRILQQTTRSIGIITSSFDRDECRSNDCAHIDKCKVLIMDLQSFLQETYPHAKVSIRNEPKETLVSAFSRMTLSMRSVCSPSTFCLYPTIATVGEGYFARSDLYPFVSEIAAQPDSNLRVIEEDFLSIQQMYELNLTSTEALIGWLRRTSSEK